MCSENQWVPGSYIQRLHVQIRIEGYGLVTLPPGYHGDGSPTSAGVHSRTPPELVPLYEYTCQNATAGSATGSNTSSTSTGVEADADAVGNGTNTLSGLEASSVGNHPYVDFAMGPAGWRPNYGGRCTRVGGSAGGVPLLYVYKDPTAGGLATNLVPLELWYKPSDHYLVASAAGKAEAAATGYQKKEVLGYVWPEPGSLNASYSRYAHASELPRCALILCSHPSHPVLSFCLLMCSKVR
jgi:hypothetical protein